MTLTGRDEWRPRMFAKQLSKVCIPLGWAALASLGSASARGFVYDVNQYGPLVGVYFTF